MRTRMRAIVVVCVVIISAVPLTVAAASPECGPPSFDPGFWVPFDPPGPDPIPFPKVSLAPGTVKPIPMPGLMPGPVQVEEPEMPYGSTSMPWPAWEADGPVEPPDLCNNQRGGDD